MVGCVELREQRRGGVLGTARQTENDQGKGEAGGPCAPNLLGRRKHKVFGKVKCRPENSPVSGDHCNNET